MNNNNNLKIDKKDLPILNQQYQNLLKEIENLENCFLNIHKFFITIITSFFALLVFVIDKNIIDLTFAYDQPIIKAFLFIIILLSLFWTFQVQANEDKLEFKKSLASKMEEIAPYPVVQFEQKYNNDTNFKSYMSQYFLPMSIFAFASLYLLCFIFKLPFFQKTAYIDHAFAFVMAVIGLTVLSLYLVQLFYYVFGGLIKHKIQVLTSIIIIVFWISMYKFSFFEPVLTFLRTK